MKETTRLPNPSISNCIDPKYQYTLLQPYLIKYTVSDVMNGDYSVAWPDEWNVGGKYAGSGAPRFTCLTEQQTGSGIPLSKSLESYTPGSCVSGKLFLDGKILKSSDVTCST